MLECRNFTPCIQHISRGVLSSDTIPEFYLGPGIEIDEK